MNQFMKRIFLSLLLMCAAFAFVGCRKGSDTNNANANTNTKAKASPTPFEGDAQTVFNKGLELQKNDREEEAVRAFEQVIKMDAEFAEAYVRLGMSLDAAGQDEKAEEAYKKAIEVYRKYVDKNPQDARGFYFLGWAYSRTDKVMDAERAFARATTLKEGYVDAMYELGVIRIKLAKYPEAIAVLKKILELDPDDYRAREALEEAEEGRKRVAEIRQNREAQNKNKNQNANANANANVGPSKTKSKDEH
jgi:tetratricopeptide (TPR) repeat protein